jgi:class 3 adenylate cyclase
MQSPSEPAQGGEGFSFSATVLFTDIVGSTERAVALGDRRWTELCNVIVKSFATG